MLALDMMLTRASDLMGRPLRCVVLSMKLACMMKRVAWGGEHWRMRRAVQKAELNRAARDPSLLNQPWPIGNGCMDCPLARMQFLTALMKAIR